jgi:hypothetical protein
MRRRWWEHQNRLRRGVHDCHHLQRAWAKYGADAFRVDVLETCFADPVVLVAREQFWLDRSAVRLFNHRRTAEQFSAEFYQTAEGKAYRKRKSGMQAKKWADRPFVERICQGCGQSFQSRSPEASAPRFCSNGCRCKAYQRNRGMIGGVCVICGTAFESRAVRPRNTCSLKCRGIFAGSGFKLDAAGADRVREALESGLTGRQAAKQFSISTAQVSRIKNGTRWSPTGSSSPV